ncbi:hypothetical protein NP493_678g01053 [Ridgeia piscesae]|uniref:Uncharacterized protein n=1 Tax=Ridgeia piscesae TaxID=27915 RepID=A0AAD9NMV8_RIDPI|nr:hypothetical protein NP493_678g01053 [Ridgeia piscesae]
MFTLHIRDIAAAGYTSAAGYAFEQLNPNSIEFKDRGSADDMTKVPLAIDTKTVIHTTSEKFLSLALDAGIMLHKWETFDIRSPRLQTLARGLRPAILRFGGNAADLLLFNRSARCPYVAGQPVSEEQIEQWENYEKYDKYDNFTMSATDFDVLNKFAAIADWLLLFDFNVLLRNGSDWDPRNAVEILKYSIEKNYTHHLAFELGNEPNGFKHRFGWPLEGDQLGRDVLMLQKTLKQDPRFSQFFADSIQVGPDVTRPPRSLKFLKKYLSVVHNSLDAVTWHQYYINGRTATVSDFIDPEILDYFPQQVDEVKAAVREARMPHAELWLGETSTAWGGGAEGLSNAYVAGFMWLDKLGISAMTGISLVVRQTFYGGHYSLIDRYLQPLPDYWLSLLFKRLVGSKVLNVTTPVRDRHTLRVYAHCTATSR